MDADTRMKLTAQHRVLAALIGVIQPMVDSKELEEFDRNVVELRRSLEAARGSLQRLIMGREHPDAVRARQVGAETLVKLGYTDESRDAGEKAHAFIPMQLSTLEKDDAGPWNLDINEATPVLPLRYRTIESRPKPHMAKDLTPFMQGRIAARKPDLGEITERFSEPDDAAPGGYCPNHQGNIYNEPYEAHEAPCRVTGCESDGHATCQHHFEDGTP